MTLLPAPRRALEIVIWTNYNHTPNPGIRIMVGATYRQTSVSFFGKNRFNLAKGLKATQVHNSDTPILSHRDWWGSGQ